MEHIVQFGIGIDDEAIRKRVVNTAEKVIIEDLKKQVACILFETKGWSKEPDTSAVSWWTQVQFNSFLSENKDAIIEAAGKHLADKLSRTKAVKDMVERIGEENGKPVH